MHSFFAHMMAAAIPLLACVAIFYLGFILPGARHGMTDGTTSNHSKLHTVY
jgi:hypothetical protein